jgi:hypothetical protein
MMNRRDAETQSKGTEPRSLTEGFSWQLSAPLRLCGKKVRGSWLPDMDLNHDKQIQSLLCYRYTIGQCKAGVKVSPRHAESRN